MSVAGIRAALVAALSDVPGLSVTGYTPAPIITGSAWVILARAVPVNYCIDEAQWFVFIAVPAGSSGATVAAGDALIDDTLPALKAVAKVTAVEPWSWPVETGGAAVPVIRFTLEA